MKHMVVLALWLATVFSAAVVAAPLTNVEKVQMQHGKLVVMQNGAAAFARENVTLPHGIVVDTNGVFKVNGGKPRQLGEGETLNREGMLLRADGSIMPVMDHVTLNRGRVVVMKDGELSDLKGTIKLGDGSVISDDAFITDARGMRRRLLDGELFKTKGGALPARDTISMDGGRVTVQKDGSQIALEPGRTIMMNDGTKVFADGTVERFDGTQLKLKDGQTLVIEGVVRR